MEQTGLDVLNYSWENLEIWNQEKEMGCPPLNVSLNSDSKQRMPLNRRKLCDISDYNIKQGNGKTSTDNINAKIFKALDHNVTREFRKLKKRFWEEESTMEKWNCGLQERIPDRMWHLKRYHC